MIAYAQLPFPIDIQAIRQEVRSLPVSWQAHFNTAHYSGEWTVLALRAPGGRETIIPQPFGDEVYQDTALMPLCPAIRELVASLGCPALSVRLLNLRQGAEIKAHRDAELSFEQGEARLHMPLFTNPDVEFLVQQQRVVMQEGECWYINANLPHQVANRGNCDRIHLVIDCEVNDWLRALFAAARQTPARPEKERNDPAAVIRELRALNTPATLALAEELERQQATG